MYFDKNAQALLKTSPWHQAVLDKIQTVQPATGVEILESPDGNYSLFYKNIFVYDAIQPLKDVRNVVSQISTTRPDGLHITIGIGLGYLVQELHDNSAGKIIVFEPDLPFLRFILENVDLTDFMQKNRLWLSTTELEMETVVRMNAAGDIPVDLVGLPSANQLYAEHIASLSEWLKKWHNQYRVDTVTLARYQLPWVEEMFKNYASLAAMHTIDEVVGTFKNKPAVVISSGPSLDKGIEALKQLADSHVLVAVGGSLRRLHQAGITPDFALFYDTIGMKEQVHGLPPEYLNKIIFVLNVVSQHEVFHAPARTKMLFLAENQFCIADWIDKTLNHVHHKLPGGSTVSMVSLQLALEMGCNPITLIGQDLAFPNNQVYAGGIMIQKTERGDLLLNNSDDLYSEPCPMTTVMGQNGEVLETTFPYSVFLKGFENFAANLKEEGKPVKLYNASIGGAAIEGYEVRPLSEFVGQTPGWKKPFAVATLSSIDHADIERKRALLQRSLDDFKNALQQTLTVLKQQQSNFPPIDFNGMSEVQVQSVIEKLRAQNWKFADILDIHPIIDFMLNMETIAYKQRVMESMEKPDALVHWYGFAQDLLQRFEAIMQDALLWAERAHQDLQKLKSATAA